MFAIFGISLILHAQRNIELPDGQPDSAVTGAERGREPCSIR
jgi:hypothetical protein